VIPSAALVTYLLAEERRSGERAGSVARFAGLGTLLTPFLFGVLVPIALFSMPYITSGSVRLLARGVLLAPTRRFALVAYPFPPLLDIIVGAVPVIIALKPTRRGQQLPGPASLQLAGVLAALLAVCWISGVFGVLVLLMRGFIPLSALVALWLLMREREEYAGTRREYVFALASVAVMYSLIQFPFAVTTYYFYAASFVPLIALAVLEGRVMTWPHAPAIFAAFYTTLAVCLFIPYSVRHYTSVSPDALLNAERGRILVTAAERRVYSALSAEVHRHADSGSYVFAEPECPEVNFLSATRSPTRNVFSDLGDPATRTARTLAALRERDVRVAILNTTPEQYGTLAPDLVATLMAQYPNHKTVGKFDVRWRD
jgi:hypothetical protein